MVYVLPWKRRSWQRALEAGRLWMSTAGMAGRLHRESRSPGGRKVRSQKGVPGCVVPKWATWAKANPLGVTIVSAGNCSRVLSLNGSVLQKVSDTLKIEERQSDNSQLEPKAGGKCGNERCHFSLYSERFPGRHTLIIHSSCLRG